MIRPRFGSYRKHNIKSMTSNHSKFLAQYVIVILSTNSTNLKVFQLQQKKTTNNIKHNSKWLIRTKQKVYAHCNGQNNKHLNSIQYNFFIAKHLAHCLYFTIVNEQIKLK